MVDEAGAWEVEEDGSGPVRHRHGDVMAIAYLYSNPERTWAECTMCQAELDLDKQGINRRV